MIDEQEISPAGVSVARGASYLFLDGLIRNIAGAAFLVYAARVLSVNEIGVLSALTLILAFFMAVGTFAIPSAVTKYISESIGMQRADMAKGIFTKALRFGFAVSFFPVVLCLGASSLLSAFFLGNAGYQSLIAILGLDAFAWLLSPFLSGTLYGLQRFRETAFSDVAAACIGYGTSAFFLAQGFGLTGVLVGWVVGDFSGLGLLFLFTVASFKSTQENRTYPFRNLVKYSTPLYVSGIVSYFSGTIDRFVLLFATGTATLGIYNVALAATTIVGLVGGSISSALFPQFSKMYGGQGRVALEGASRMASRYFFFIYVPMAVGLATVSLPTITLLVGPQYAAGWLPLTIVSLNMALTSVGLITGSLLMSLGVTRIFLESNILAIFVGTVMSLILASIFGITGVALARATIVVVPFIYSLARLKKLFGLHFDLGAFRKSLVASAGMATAVAVTELVSINQYLLPLYVLVGVIVYALMLRLTKAMNRQDITVLKQIFPKRLGRAIDEFAKILNIKTKD